MGVRIEKRYSVYATLVAFLVILNVNLHAQTPSGGRLGDMLDEQGRLDVPEGFTGSLDATGWMVATAPDGSPRFYRAGETPSSSARIEHPDDIYWDSRFVPRGTEGEVHVVAVTDCDEFYVGGRFATFNGVTVNNIAKWNGSSWVPLGDGQDIGVNGVVFAITVNFNHVYVGGRFDAAGGQPASNVARWDGAEWSNLGASLSDPRIIPTVRAIAVSGTSVYIGGLFQDVGNTRVNNIAVWNGFTWSALGNGVLAGVNSEVLALTVRAGTLYVGGRFSRAGNVQTRGIAVWSNNTWSDLAGGVQGTISTVDSAYVASMALGSEDLYIGGSFSTAGTVDAGHVARYHFPTGMWHPLGNGSLSAVSAVAVTGSRIFAGGRFRDAQGQPVNNIGVWDGVSWHSLGRGLLNGTDSLVRSIGIMGRDVYVGGSFSTAGAIVADGLAHWNISTLTWAPLMQDVGSSEGVGGINGPVYAMALRGDEVYLGGQFTSAGDIRVDNLVRWDASVNAWRRLGPGVSATRDVFPPPQAVVYALAIDGSDIFVGGRFDSAGSVAVKNIARWDGREWHALGEGIGPNAPGKPYDSLSVVRALAVDGDNLYVGGSFDLAGGARANRVAVWNRSGRTWSALGSGVGGSSFFTFVNAIAVKGTDVYVGGNFPVAGALRVNNIARWDGNEWVKLGGGVNGQVNAMLFGPNDDLYVGGEFPNVGSGDDRANAKNIARWDGTRWHEFGNGLNGPVQALAVTSTGTLYMGGEFAVVDNVVANHVALRSDSKWVNLGSGLIVPGGLGTVYALAAEGEDLWAGGDFLLAGGNPSANFAHWNKPVPVVASAPEGRIIGYVQPAAHPNPFSATTTIRFDMMQGTTVRLALFDSRGVEVLVLFEGYLEEGSHEIACDAAQLSRGTYFCRLTGQAVSGTIPVIVD